MPAEPEKSTHSSRDPEVNGNRAVAAGLAIAALAVLVSAITELSLGPSLHPTPPLVAVLVTAFAWTKLAERNRWSTPLMVATLFGWLAVLLAAFVLSVPGVTDPLFLFAKDMGSCTSAVFYFLAWLASVPLAVIGGMWLAVRTGQSKSDGRASET